VPVDATEGSWSLLDLLEDEDRHELEGRAGRRRFKAGSTLMHEGSPSSEVLLLLSGWVKVTITTDEGREIVLQFCGPGDLVGELSVIDQGARSATAEALEPVEALALSAAEFRAMIETRPTLASSLLRSLVRRFRDADRKRIEFAAAQTLGRVAARLVELVDRHGEPSDGGIEITLPISQEELAGWTGSSREAVAKALHTLRSLGLIRTERRHIFVLDEEALRRQAP
jgi:CRP/FNR family transcriptional regulator, cyclic AMP receptor protein